MVEIGLEAGFEDVEGIGEEGGGHAADAGRRCVSAWGRVVMG